MFTSGMVLQRDQPARIAGWADVGERVVVRLGERTVGSTVGAGAPKLWSVTLPVLSAGPVDDISVEGKNLVKLTNLLAGDVWVCSGQSNMEQTMARGDWCNYGGVRNGGQEMAVASHPRIRLFISASKQPWMECSPETVRRFSAAGYFFGRELHRELDVPVGLVMAAVGGTPAEYWTPRKAREAWAGHATALGPAQKVLREWRPQFDADRKTQAEWSSAEGEAKKRGSPAPPRPAHKLTVEQQELVRAAIHVVNVGSGYAARIQPLTAMTIKGAIWYQGEANVGRAAEYAELMTQLIGGWREDWGQGDFPFLIMQLVNFGADGTQWSALRAAQQTVADTVSHTGMAVGIDIGDSGNIHPENKQEVGSRLALVALKNVYGRNVVAAGPKLTGTRFDAGKAQLTFDQPVILKGRVGFEMAGKDGRFHPALAVAQENTITLTAPEIAEPHRVRYAWRDNPPVTVFNSTGLPAAPFQTP
ncbi:MAG: hypothetical protein NTV80_07395 [Verrucomicrobia bacterium]|nr:hypothetical protein [Verrucomicrobiota bacterium]